MTSTEAFNKHSVEETVKQAVQFIVQCRPNSLGSCFPKGESERYAEALR